MWVVYIIRWFYERIMMVYIIRYIKNCGIILILVYVLPMAESSV